MDETSDVLRSESQDGVEFILPPRTVPRALPWFLLCFGIAITIFMIFWMGGPAFFWHHLGPGSRAPAMNPGEWMGVAFSLLGLPGLAGGLGFMVLGTLLLVYDSRCSVVLGERELRLLETLGPCHWSWTVPRADLRALSIGGSGFGRSTGGRQVSTYQAVLVRRTGRKDLALAIGYDPAVLEALSAGLTEELRHGGVDVPVAVDPRLGPPPGNLEVEEDGTRIAIALPRPARPWPLLVFAIAWLGVCACITVGLLGPGGSGRPQHSGGPVAAIVMAVFWIFGIVALLLCVDSGWRRSSLLWDGTALSLISRSPLRRCLVSWNGNEILDLTMEERGTSSGRYQALTVTPKQGKQRDLPLRRDPIAMAWIAARLRLLVLQRPPEDLVDVPAGPATAGVPPPGTVQALPSGSAIRIEASRDGVEITFPARGLFAGSYGLVMVGVVFMAIAIGIAVVGAKQVFADHASVGLPVFIALFFVLGGVLATIGARMGTRRTQLRLDASELVIEARDCLGGGKQTMPRAQLASIRVEDSAIEVNNRKLRRLALVPRTGKALTCGTGWQPAELEAVAAALRIALG